MRRHPHIYSSLSSIAKEAVGFDGDWTETEIDIEIKIGKC